MDEKLIYNELMALVKEMREVLKEQADKFAEFIKTYLEKKLKETLKHPSMNNPQGRTSGFKDAIPNVKTRVIRESEGGYKITAFAFMSVSGTPAPHFVWHVINRGRKAYTAKRLQVFPIRVAARTFPNSYKVGRFPGWSGKWAAIPVGGTVKGFEARNFYAAIVNDLRKEIAKKFPEFTETKVEIKN